MEQLGHEDWRFIVVQKLCGITYNKVSDGAKNVALAPIRNILIDKKDQTITSFVCDFLDDFSSQTDIKKLFSSSLDPKEDCIVDFDLVLSAIL